MTTQSSRYPALAEADEPLPPFALPAAAADPFDSLDPLAAADDRFEPPALAVAPPEVVAELVAVPLLPAVDELFTPLPGCTVTEEPSGKVVEPDSPPGPVVTVLDGPPVAAFARPDVTVPDELVATPPDGVVVTVLDGVQGTTRQSSLAASLSRCLLLRSAPDVAVALCDPVPPALAEDAPLSAVAQGSAAA